MLSNQPSIGIVTATGTPVQKRHISQHSFFGRPVTRTGLLRSRMRHTTPGAMLVLRCWRALEGKGAVALELIIKAVIAEQFRLRHASESERVPTTHDIPKLWLKAGLPELEKEDKYRLLLFKRVLSWSGRYATPRSAKAWAEENRTFAELDCPTQWCGWEEFDRLFQTARARLLSP